MKIPKRIASAIINSLKGGVVPRIGLPYITVGREQEINALLHDVDIIADGGASFRFIVGKYGSGKSFLLQTIRSYVMDRNFVVVDADLSPERRLQGTKGQGLATYKELIRNMSTKTRPDGGALTLILDRWISNVQSETAAESGLEFDGMVNLMKGAIETADRITTVSPTYAKELLDPWYSYGMDRALVRRQDGIVGILNGIDVIGYDPETDPNLKKNYSVTKMAGKKECRAALLKECGLTDSDAPVIGIVTRFVAHKGIQLVQQTFQEMLQLGCRFVVLGSGERLYEDFFREMQAEYPEQVHVTVGFVPAMARRIYGGADMFLMPSQNEPCGLAQMVAMRYGTIPVVRETGGLKDSVFDAGGKDGNHRIKR